jgi:regulator of sirC expression with transglutaminase-like and TPR domain
VISRLQAQDQLRQVGSLADAEIDLAGTALALAALERPEVSLDRYHDHLARLTDAVAEQAARSPEDVEARVAALRAVLAEHYGYAGDTLTYDDLQNANLMRVIDRRKGLPVALGILYIGAARGLGWDIHGLNFPGHFLIRLNQAGERAILDPFNGGQTRTVMELRDLLKAGAGLDAELTPEHYATVGNRDILLRLQNNLKLRFLKSDRVDKAVEVLNGMLLFAPNEAGLWREAGLFQAYLGNLGAAVTALEHFMMLATNETLRHQTALLLQQLKTKLN